MSSYIHGVHSYWLVVLTVHRGQNIRDIFLQSMHEMHLTASRNSKRAAIPNSTKCRITISWLRRSGLKFGDCGLNNLDCSLFHVFIQDHFFGMQSTKGSTSYKACGLFYNWNITNFWSVVLNNIFSVWNILLNIQFFYVFLDYCWLENTILLTNGRDD